MKVMGTKFSKWLNTEMEPPPFTPFFVISLFVIVACAYVVVLTIAHFLVR